MDINLIKWMFQYQELIRFKKAYGNCDVLSKHKDKKLVNWVQTQRTYYKKGKLDYERIRLLEEIGFNWHIKKDIFVVWKENYQELVHFKDTYGHCDVTTKHKDKKLFNWVLTQRTYYKKGKLDQERIILLEKIGFNWHTPRDFFAIWKENYQELVRFKDTYGHCDVPTKYKENKKLANWVQTQNIYYKKGKLDQERIILLEEIGFNWHTPRNLFVIWKENYQELVRFKDTYGHCDVTTKHKDKKLFNWVQTQRTYYKKGKLDEERIRLLKEIGFFQNQKIFN